jgi:hypothetical protein
MSIDAEAHYGGDLQIVRPNDATGCFQISANFSTPSCAEIIERK